MEYTYNVLYVVSCFDGKYHKIGVCKENNFNRRLKSLQTGNPHKIQVEWVEERTEANKAESYLHGCFAEKRTNGEWFEDITVNDIRKKLMLFLDQR
jgi:hypothetical protein